ncbi:MAG: DUF3575 domain-containing protein [Bacteroidaceae bacterium]|nr:DUF3575 domain-containing protein [Bacteroidaceae bacterium]
MTKKKDTIKDTKTLFTHFTAWTLLLSACLSCVFLHTRAQGHLVLPYYSNAKGGISVLVDDVQLTRQGQSTLTLQMQFSLVGTRQPSNYTTELVPRLYTATDSVDFPAVRMLGRNAYYHDVRSPWAPDSAVMEMRDRDVYEPKTYAKQVPYQSWMSGARLKFVVTAQNGCGDGLSRTEKEYALPHLQQQRVATTERHNTVSTQQTQQLQGRANISFRKNVTTIDPDYQDNAHELERIHHSIDSLLQQKGVVMKHLTLKGYASPEGSYLTNVQLASGRVHSLKQYLMDTFGLEGDIISVDYEAEDWEGLRNYVDGSSLRDREALLAIIDGVQDPDERLKQISRRYPKAYRHMMDSVFINLRHTDYRVDYLKVWEKEEHTSTYSADSTGIDKIYITGQVPEGPTPQLTESHLRRFKPLVSVKTNLLFDAALTPNVELEVQLGRKGKWSRWSLMAEMWFPWWRMNTNPDGYENPYLRPDQRPTKKSFELLTGGLELRYWLRPRCTGSRPWLTGTFIGVYAAGGKYDFEWKSEGSQGEFISGGISVGHSWAIARHWNIELSAAAGYVYTPYRYYEAEFDDTHLIYQYSNQKNLFLPTKLKVSLVYHLGKKISKNAPSPARKEKGKKKGGAK